ncbi:glycosyltransferase [Fusobacterium sp. PH5-44]|uniref:glycosyltransferase n=1 Tax=unclassified Fusobacterium TaxID=2648384 RepID=UPI003D1A769C
MSGKIEKIKVSIVVPVYNVEKYILRCIDSLINQTLEDIEIIIVNDGTKDKSIKLIKENFSDARLVMIEQENMGLSEARNTGIRNARGNYILFVDSDDFIDNDMCKTLYENSNDGDIIFSNYYKYYKTKKEEINFSIKIQKYFGINIEKNIKYDGQYVYERSVAAVWDKLYKRDFLLRNNLFFTPKILHEDLNFSLKAFLLTENIYYYNKAFYNYWQENDNSIMNSMKNEVEVRSYQEIINDLKKFSETMNDNFKKLRIILIINQYKVIISALNKKNLEKIEIKNIIKNIKGCINFIKNDYERKIIKHELLLLLNMRPFVKNISIKDIFFFEKDTKFILLSSKILRRKILKKHY